MSEKRSTAGELSSSFRLAVKRGARFTVTVAAGHGYPSSGVLYAPGWVLTAEHAVDRDEGIEITLPGGAKETGRVAGRDPVRDLALLKLDSDKGQAAERAGAPAEVGQLVLALGRPTDEGIQASLGIVSVVNGVYRGAGGIAIEGLMRSDAVRLPGFAGGPLVDAEGALLGINTLRSSGGTSVTLPAEAAWQIAARLREEGSLKTGYLGIRSQQVELPAPVSLGREQATGLLVVGVQEGSPADKAGLMVGDILVGLGGQPIPGHEALLEVLLSGVAGTAVSAELIRAGDRVELPITVGTLEPERGSHGGADRRFWWRMGGFRPGARHPHAGRAPGEPFPWGGPPWAGWCR